MRKPDENNYSQIYTWKHRIIAVHGALIIGGYFIFKILIPILVGYNLVSSVSQLQFFTSEFITGTSAISLWSGYFGKNSYKEYISRVLTWTNWLILLVLWIAISYFFGSLYSSRTILHGLLAGYLVTFGLLLVLKIKKRDTT